jgi:hypothetical protein
LEESEEKYKNAVAKLQYVAIRCREHLDTSFLESLKNEHGVIL